jgi:putative N-acetyltransferase (TIGR04045 family)
MSASPIMGALDGLRSADPAWMERMCLLGEPPRPEFTIGPAEDRSSTAAYLRLRHRAFVDEQALFDRHDLDHYDDDPRSVVLVARNRAGDVIGGVRLGPITDGVDLGWWYGGRLVVDPARRGPSGVGAALVRAACAYAEAAGVLRFEATVQDEGFFARLGWLRVGPAVVAGRAHTVMRWPIGRVAALADATKRPLGSLLTHLLPRDEFLGDDGAPVPGSDLVAACDAIVSSMVERDPDWAGWCSVLVNVNDLAAMGAEPIGLLDAVGARDASSAALVLGGLARASAAFGVPVLGGHTQLGVPAALSVTALGRTADPIPGGGGRPGQRLRLTADLGGGWRPGYSGRQWDSSSHRTRPELAVMTSAVRHARPSAAKDVSMAGIVGTVGMMAEASGCAAVLDVAGIPRPAGASMGDWLTCFPGFGMVTADSAALPAGPAVGAECGELLRGSGVRLRWPDGETTSAVTGGMTGLGAATNQSEVA